jgi:hypothetical protein
MAVKRPVMRQIAKSEIAKLFPGIAADALEGYVTSVVRQWVTNDFRACSRSSRTAAGAAA